MQEDKGLHTHAQGRSVIKERERKSAIRNHTLQLIHTVIFINQGQEKYNVVGTDGDIDSRRRTFFFLSCQQQQIQYEKGGGLCK